MAHIFEDRVLETTTTTGTGALTLGGAVAGFRTFASVMSASDVCWYALWAVDSNGNATGDYEEGLGTFNTTLTRTTVIRSSNSNAAVSLSAGTKYVAIAALATKLLQLDNEGTSLMPAAAPASLNPVSAPSGYLKVYNQVVAGLPTPRYIGPYGVDQTLQDKISENGVSIYMPNNGGTLGLNLGQAWTSFGTLSHPTPSSTSPAIYNQMKRSRFANVATTTNQILGLGCVTAEKRFWRGNAAGLGGFNFHCRFAIGLWPAATVRVFVGLSDISLTTSAGVSASDTVSGNCCGFHHITTDAATALFFTTRDGTTTNRVSLGTLANALAAGNVYDAWIYCPPNGSTIYYRLVDIRNNVEVASGSTATNLPSATAFMGPEVTMSNGTANTTVTTTAMEVCALSVQSDN